MIILQQTTGQEISAAELLKLMSAQHHAVHQNPQGITQGTYLVCLSKILFCENNEYGLCML